MFRRTRVSSGLSGREGNTYVEKMAPSSLVHRPGLMADARTTRRLTVTPKEQEAMPPQKTFTEKCWTWWLPSLWAFGWVWKERDERWDENETLFFSCQCQSELVHLVVLVMCLVWCLVSRLYHVSSVFPCVFPSSFLFSSCYINIPFLRSDLLLWADITTSWTWWSFSLSKQFWPLKFWIPAGPSQQIF